MVDTEWQALLVGLRDVDDVETAAVAAADLRRKSTTADIPGLVELLGDESFFVREAAAWPLSDLGCVELLPQLIAAFQRGLDEGHDNDGFAAALTDLVEINRERARVPLEALATSAEASASSHAKWLLEFV